MVWAICIGVFAVFGVLWLASRWVVGRPSRTVKLRPGYFCLVVGNRGFGKSLFIARLVRERAAAGVPVYANFHIEGAHYIETWEDVIMAPRGAWVILDEVPGWAGARAGQTLRPAAAWYVAQCRKLDHEVTAVAQHERQVAGVVVDLVNEIIECKKLGGGNHRAASYAPHDFRKKGAKPLWSWSYTVRAPAARTYGTLDLIPPEPTRGNRYDDDVDMIVRCIARIRERDRLDAEQAAQLEAWFEAAGVN